MNDESAARASRSRITRPKSHAAYNSHGRVAKAALEASVTISGRGIGQGQHPAVNAISAGPIKTLAASGIGDFRFTL